MLWITRVFDNASKIHELEIQTSYTKYYTPLHAPWSINLTIVRSSTHPCSTRYVHSWRNLLGVRWTSTRHVRVRFEASVLGSRCPCWVRGVRVGFKVFTLGSRCPRWVRGVRIGFEVFMSVERKGWNEFATYHLNHSFPPSSLSHIFLRWVKTNQPTSLNPHHCHQISVVVELISSLSNPYCCGWIRVIWLLSLWNSNMWHCWTCIVCWTCIGVVESMLLLSNPCRKEARVTWRAFEVGSKGWVQDVWGRLMLAHIPWRGEGLVWVGCWCFGVRGRFEVVEDNAWEYWDSLSLFHTRLPHHVDSRVFYIQNW